MGHFLLLHKAVLGRDFTDPVDVSQEQRLYLTANLPATSEKFTKSPHLIIEIPPLLKLCIFLNSPMIFCSL